ncbi:MAG: Gfo/Idh/MocA family oxidoreductase [Planctomycetota bacterium]
MRFTRRQIVKSGLAVGGAAMLGPSIVHGQGANETLNLAAVGIGGKGDSDLSASAAGKNVRVVGLCDVDSNALSNAANRYADAKSFKDYRVMLDKMGKDIDALLVSTPDHMHGPIALAAMELGIHVHVQKPLAHNIAELRAMQRMAEKNPKLVTQMGSQIHSYSAYRTAAATVRSGAIGKVSEAHLWVSKSWSGPEEGRPNRQDPVPASLDWDLWLGVAPHRPYANGAYHPANWRKWRDFGTGTLGDMGCHIYDPVFSCLDLGMPTSVVSKGPQTYEETFAPDTDVRYTFGQTPYTTEEVKFRWTDGRQNSRPDGTRAQGAPLPGAGMFLVGEKAVMVTPHIGSPYFYKDGKKVEVEVVEKGSNDHYTEFTDACRGIGETSTPFSYSARVTEAVLVGVVASSFKDRELKWDSPNLAFDHKPATDLVHRTYRDGWGMNKKIRLT